MAKKDYISKKVKIGRKKNEVGNIYGRLTVYSSAESIGNHAAWNCICECGNNSVVTGTHLRSGHTLSCGCLHKDNLTKHGECGSKEYQIWSGMISRCYNQTNKNFSNYGGRGISVCDRWRESPTNFILDMGKCGDGMSIERNDVNGNYEPSNCRWATDIEQARNKRTNNVIEFNGLKMCLTEWAEKTGINPSTLFNRLTVRGWSIEKSLTHPVRFKSQSIGI